MGYNSPGNALLSAAEAPAARRAAAVQRESAETAYLAWVGEELRYLPIIPIGSTRRQEQLQIAEVYIRLRVVERAQIEGFRQLVRGDFDPEGEYACVARPSRPWRAAAACSAC